MRVVTRNLAARQSSPSAFSKSAISASRCRYSSVSVQQAVNLVASGLWDLPVFQRAFVWRPAQVSNLADSLWRGYPIGPLLIWEPSQTQAHTPLWVADGQQRLTSLCVLFGKTPPWWGRRESDRRNFKRRFDLRFDVDASLRPVFRCSFDGKFKDYSEGLVKVAEIMAHDPTSEEGVAALQAIASRIKEGGFWRAASEELSLKILSRVAMIRHMRLATTLIGCELDDALEIFERLSGGGTRFRKMLLNLAMAGLASASRAALARADARELNGRIR